MPPNVLRAWMPAVIKAEAGHHLRRAAHLSLELLELLFFLPPVFLDFLLRLRSGVLYSLCTVCSHHNLEHILRKRLFIDRKDSGL